MQEAAVVDAVADGVDARFEQRLRHLTEKRRLAMFRAFKQVELMDRISDVYYACGEEPPEVSEDQLQAMAERLKPRSKWAVQHEFMQKFSWLTVLGRPAALEQEWWTNDYIVKEKPCE